MWPSAPSTACWPALSSSGIALTIGWCIVVDFRRLARRLKAGAGIAAELRHFGDRALREKVREAPAALIPCEKVGECRRGVPNRIAVFLNDMRRPGHQRRKALKRRGRRLCEHKIFEAMLLVHVKHFHMRFDRRLISVRLFVAGPKGSLAQITVELGKSGNRRLPAGVDHANAEVLQRGVIGRIEFSEPARDSRVGTRFRRALDHQNAAREEALAEALPKLLPVALELDAIGERDGRIGQRALGRARKDQGLVDLELLEDVGRVRGNQRLRGQFAELVDDPLLRVGRDRDLDFLRRVERLIEIPEG